MTQNNGRMKLELKHTSDTWPDVIIDTEFGKVKISHDSMTHQYRMKKTIEKCFKNARAGSSFPGLLGNFFYLR